MRILTFTTLYPNNMQPNLGLFVEHRLVNFLRMSDDYLARVVAPVPWFPFKNRRFGKYAKFALVSGRDHRRGVDVMHPRFPVIPKIGMSLAPISLASFCYPAIRKIITDGWDFDVIDAHYFFPDGVAATLLGHWLNKPVVITARGTDINVIPNWRIPRKQICWTIEKCDAMITVSEALRSSLIELGAGPDKVTALRNGVDLEFFQPRDKALARQKLRVKPTDTLLISVGNLVENKGHHLVIDALAKLDDGVSLMIVGEGEERASLLSRAKEIGVETRVRFCGSVNQSELPWFYSAADILVLASGREGMANVLLESLACGTPVVATNVSGAPEIIVSGICGQLVDLRSAESIACGVRSLLSNYPNVSSIRAFAKGLSWDATSLGQRRVFQDVTRRKLS